MTESTNERYRAFARIDFPRVQDYLHDILASIATHDMSVNKYGDAYRVMASFAQATLSIKPQQLLIEVETTDRAGLNRMKLALGGLIGFIAANERLHIGWQGDMTGLAVVEDLRVIHVVETVMLTPRLRRIVFEGADLGHFQRDDQMHCRLIFVPKGEHEPVWPMVDDQGRVIWLGDKMHTRVYTIRELDAKRGRLTIDFALHPAVGPATSWAMAACRGDQVGIVGPAAGGLQAASFIVLAGDETALPGIARILEALPQDARGKALIEVQDAGECLSLTKPLGVQLQWLLRHDAMPGTTTLLLEALQRIDWPADLSDVFFWGGCEYRAFSAIHRYLRRELGLAAAQQVLYSHWHLSLSEEQIIEVGGQAYLAE
ncbi:NADPH-dependent ferric siderophore reductase, contains FAD-binding and SIP domains [Pseudomonas flavescens]|uniref:NADPH-dependent ferric siderophore reductase, contains FAD-binding and SIP domains n=1 Tax=Phytopseudomonas flavescens TaxID=29435 RepID=A0A1G8P5X1_9GAMM|nr:siderophore-interacting protein [Pseudomonas flavescens]SDI87822.1 NADPH-dependent ferric siderophore reductase, contains FAD-binding and SIP domains [Pseudomonas flavescens]